MGPSAWGGSMIRGLERRLRDLLIANDMYPYLPRQELREKAAHILCVSLPKGKTYADLALLRGLKRRDAPPTSNFYESREWQTLRYRVLKLHGGRCQCCGARPTDDNPLHVDHIKPRSRYPQLALDITNLQILCKACNLGKRAWDETDWRRPSEPLQAENDPARPISDDTYTKYQAARRRFARTCAQ